ncbi:MAG: Rne/Rng family ribonuclease [Deltaproteobacteria bacterium]|jgi:ribonuclease G|nr:Rne/Rng family ribonuclease [Deltaproteobacteria bacterium]
MQNEILISASPGETRVAIYEKKQFVELHIERAKSKSVVGAVCKGKVSRVLPGMQAAFVDIGLDKAAFLYAGDYVENIEKLDSKEGDPRGRRRRGARQVPNIETLLQEGQEIVVQIAKEPIGTKGARITSHVSIPGRHLVLTPWAQKVGVSRKIDADRERRRLRDIVNKVKPADLGFIIRTAGDGTREADLEADVNYLTSVWDDVQIKKDRVSAPAFLYEEPPLALRVVRDFTDADTRRIVIDSPEAHRELTDFVDKFVADPKPKIELYEGADPIFDHFGCEAQIDANLGRKVWLKSGGYLIIDQSEALTAIDVNTGRYVGKRDLEETVLRTNLEAVREVVNQLRFRNIGGLIIIDLIDMESGENRDKTYRALQEAIRSDKAKTNILKISELGLVEMTRKRTRENLVQMLCEPCAYCEGKGYVLSDESVAHKILREIRKDLPRFIGREVAVTVSRRVAEQLLGSEKGTLRILEEELGREIEIRARSDFHQEQFEITSEGAGPALSLSMPWLTERPSDAKPKRGGNGKARPRAAEAVVAQEPLAEADSGSEPEPDAEPQSDSQAEAEAPGAVEEEAAAAPEETPAEPEPEEPAAAAQEEGEAVEEPSVPAGDEPEPPAMAVEDEASPVVAAAPDEEEAETPPTPTVVAGPVDAPGESPILGRFQDPEES